MRECTFRQFLIVSKRSIKIYPNAPSQKPVTLTPFLGFLFVRRKYLSSEEVYRVTERLVAHTKNIFHVSTFGKFAKRYDGEKHFIYFSSLDFVSELLEEGRRITHSADHYAFVKTDELLAELVLRFSDTIVCTVDLKTFQMKSYE